MWLRRERTAPDRFRAAGRRRLRRGSGGAGRAPLPPKEPRASGRGGEQPILLEPPRSGLTQLPAQGRAVDPLGRRRLVIGGVAEGDGVEVDAVGHDRRRADRVEELVEVAPAERRRARRRRATRAAKTSSAAAASAASGQIPVDPRGRSIERTVNSNWSLPWRRASSNSPPSFQPATTLMRGRTWVCRLGGRQAGSIGRRACR